jgi:DNA-directed RNA polymerase subunit M/transcription elongation factor TFIIS
MWITKGCPRCKGNLFIEESIGSRFEKCLQCGYEKETLKTVNMGISQPVTVKEHHRRGY